MTCERTKAEGQTEFMIDVSDKYAHAEQLLSSSAEFSLFVY